MDNDDDNTPDTTDTPSVEKIKVIVQEYLEGEITYKKLSEKYGYKEDRIRKWVSRSNQGCRITGKPGSPLLLDNDEGVKLVELVKKGDSDGECIRQNDFKILLLEAIRRTSLKDNIYYTGSLSDDTYYHYLNKLNLKVVNAEIRPNARVIAQNNAMNAVSNIVMLNHVANNIAVPNQFVNFDATQFYIGQAMSDMTKVVVSIDRESKDHISTAKRKSDKASKYYVKWFCVINSNGFMHSSQLFLVADEKMGAEDFEAYEVTGLSTATTEGASGYVCFTKTRCGNEKFFKFFNEHILIKFANSIYEKSIPNSAIANGKDKIFICCDGEGIQIKPYFDNKIKILFRRHNCNIIKFAASTTAISQPCDAYNLFKAIKTYLKSHPDDFDQLSNTVLIENLTIAFNARETANPNRTKLQPVYKMNMIALIAKAFSAISTVVIKKLIQNSFIKIGFNPYNKTVDIDQVLNQYKININPTDRAQLEESVPALVTTFNNNGEVTRGDMEHLGVVTKYIEANNLPAERKKKAISRRSCVQLNNEQIQVQNHQNNNNKKRKASNILADDEGDE